jgi:hypothetical protein
MGWGAKCQFFLPVRVRQDVLGGRASAATFRVVQNWAVSIRQVGAPNRAVGVAKSHKRGAWRENVIFREVGEKEQERDLEARREDVGKGRYQRGRMSGACRVVGGHGENVRESRTGEDGRWKREKVMNR